MRVLITGSSGLVGKNLVENATKNEIICPTHAEMDLLNFSQTLKYIKRANPDLIIHAAGVVGGIQANIANPVRFLNENFEIGNNLIKAAFECKVQRLLNLGSSCMYPRDAHNPLKENYILKGELEPTNEGYALAKIYAMRFCQYLNQENHSFQYKTIIPCNLYGKWDKFSPDKSHLIPSIIRKIHLAKVNNLSSVEIWGNGSARREFMYAGDLADFIWFAVDRFENLPEFMNVGLGFDYSILEYYEAVRKVINYKGDFTFNLTMPVGMQQKLLDVSKCNILGWRPKHSLKEGLTKTYKYYLLNHE